MTYSRLLAGRWQSQYSNSDLSNLKSSYFYPQNAIFQVRGTGPGDLYTLPCIKNVRTEVTVPTTHPSEMAQVSTQLSLSSRDSGERPYLLEVLSGHWQQLKFCITPLPSLPPPLLPTSPKQIPKTCKPNSPFWLT